MDEDLLQLSGIQHFMFCPRQWALIHVEQLWADNVLTAEGQILHQRVDDNTVRQLNGGVLTLRRVPLVSRRLRLSGLSDAVECRRADEGAPSSVQLPERDGWWTVMPVEYKRGHAKYDETDEVQLCAQCMALEEMNDIVIPRAAIFYWETRARTYVDMTDDLRNTTARLAGEMWSLMAQGKTPPPQKGARCGRCSLADLCMRKAASQLSATDYLKKNLYAEDA
ncbi:MAG: CRISPR-associated protein Cas4 [Bacteroidales bacterium]|nr:CRISPR-associated protein Cas4 [Bacteroidales bacterium]MDY4174630.1 CRISPR-associated protein Cas4 [Bacteroidales bacterium]